MNLMDPEIFFVRFLPLYFKECLDSVFNDTSKESWLDVGRPINIYKCVVDFLMSLRSSEMSLRPKFLLALLDKHFVMPLDVIQGRRPCPKENKDVGSFLVDELP